MLPALTNSPPKVFTPSIFGLESRPFLVEPTPFLCAITIRKYYSLSTDAVLTKSRTSEIAQALSSFVSDDFFELAAFFSESAAFFFGSFAAFFSVFAPSTARSLTSMRV